MKYSFYIVFLFISFFAYSQENYRDLARKGNKAYKDGDFEKAIFLYKKAENKNPNFFESKFNKADALYEMEKYEESEQILNNLSNIDISDEKKAMVYHNLGNNLLKQKKYKESLEAYKKSLRISPKDDDARYNYEYARKMLRKQQEQKKQDKKDDKDKKDNKEDKNKKNDKDKKEKNKKNDKGKKKKNKKNDEDKKEKEEKQKDYKISKKTINQLLKANENKEKKIQKKLQKKKLKGKPKKIDKNW